MNRAVILSLEKRKAIVLAPGGQFVRVKRLPHFRIGDEIEWARTGARRGLLGRRRTAAILGASAVAAFVLLLGLWWFQTPTVVAYVSMDVNPSVEMGIDSREYVRELRALNADARPIVAAIEYKGQSVENVTARLAEELASRKLLDSGGEVVLASVAVGKVDAEWEAEIIGSMKKAIEQTAKRLGGASDNAPEIMAVSVPAEVREEAKKSGLSTGKMAFWLKAESQGHEVPLETLRHESMKTIASEWGGVQQVLTGNKPNPDTKSESASSALKSGSERDEWNKLLAALKDKVEEDRKKRDEMRKQQRQENRKKQNYREKQENGGRNANQERSGKQESTARQTSGGALVARDHRDRTEKAGKENKIGKKKDREDRRGDADRGARGGKTGSGYRRYGDDGERNNGHRNREVRNENKIKGQNSGNLISNASNRQTENHDRNPSRRHDGGSKRSADRNQDGKSKD
ncbi:MAG: hypothetical protein C6P35_03895 [Cohnella sp.]|uniref:anti-sigma-I factor RsgI family protein n=1 Tax=Cohnella sp. TaxID=1883426 RepID=UPI000E36E00C|nr:anti-sigma factor domain-containing protein [Cohnella sp.]REK67866.1 MAG: hypothetical protein C6P35_03895 [Cohnella sp.]